MSDDRNKRYGRVHTSHKSSLQQDATLKVMSREYDHPTALDFKETVVDSYTLTFMPDTNEVIFAKGDEILYSEILS